MSDVQGLNIYVVYNKPKDFPEEFVVRRWLVTNDGRGLPNKYPMLRGKDLDAVRASLTNAGLHRIERFVNDDPVILETWV